MEQDKQLASELNSHATISVQGKGVDIEPAEESAPKQEIRLTVDPNFVYEHIMVF